jgi:hypothetical protein
MRNPYPKIEHRQTANPSTIPQGDHTNHNDRSHNAKHPSRTHRRPETSKFTQHLEAMNRQNPKHQTIKSQSGDPPSETLEQRTRHFAGGFHRQLTARVVADTNDSQPLSLQLSGRIHVKPSKDAIRDQEPLASLGRIAPSDEPTTTTTYCLCYDSHRQYFGTILIAPLNLSGNTPKSCKTQ